MRTGPDRSSDHGPKTVRTGLRTGPGPVFSRTDPSLEEVIQKRSIEEVNEMLKLHELEI